MAHKTFISYVYGEANELRDKIYKAFGNEKPFYRGETAESRDLGDLQKETIKKELSSMIYDTSVTIVILSPSMRKSKWMDWEIKYSLRNKTRNDRTSHPNGIVGVIMKYNGRYDWFKYNKRNYKGIVETKYREEYLLPIIKKNRYNQNSQQKYDDETKKELYGSYISFVEEEEFILCPKFYIDNAYDKSWNDGAGYDIVVNV